MRHLGILLVTSIVAAACASNTPPAASSDSVAQASNVPNKGPDFAPASSDGLATAPADARRANNPTQPAPNLNPPPANNGNNTAPSAAASNGTWGNGADGSPGVNPANGNAAASPAPDNSRINQRDRSSAALTPMDQGTSEADRTMTQQIRQAVMRDKALSFSAKNIKIITVNGKVTLRGPVKTDAERAAIEADARRVAGGAQVDSQLEVSK
ncbi:MAG TPA: BON domain-containing protein [Polyangiaceae bacterium]